MLESGIRNEWKKWGKISWIIFIDVYFNVFPFMFNHYTTEIQQTTTWSSVYNISSFSRSEFRETYQIDFLKKKGCDLIINSHRNIHCSVLSISSLKFLIVNIESLQDVFFSVDNPYGVSLCFGYQEKNIYFYWEFIY